MAWNSIVTINAGTRPGAIILIDLTFDSFITNYFLKMV